MKRLLPLLILCLAWPAAAQEPVAYEPPPVGLRMVMDATADGIPMEMTSEVVATKGDDVLVETEVFGMRERSTYFRWLLSKDSNGMRYRFDEAAVAALWPLEPGKRIETPVEASGEQGTFSFLLQAEVERFETLELPSGRFETVVIAHTLTLQSGPPELLVETQTWLEVEHGIALKTETVLTIDGSAQHIAFTTRELRLP